MVDIPEEVRARFNGLLINKSVPSKNHNHYRKWLRYYLDFCWKYRLHHSSQQSLVQFIKKLKEKRQTEEQQKQASHAVSLYYLLMQTGSKKKATSI